MQVFLCILLLQDDNSRMAKGYISDVWETYVKSDKPIVGPVAGAANVFFRGTDELWRWVSGQEYQAPQGIMGNTRRDLSALFSNVSQGKFLKAGSNALSLVFGDIPADIVDTVGGFRRS